MEEKLLRCCDCGESFSFSIQDQQRLLSSGLANQPTRCTWCRALKKVKNGEPIGPDNSNSSGSKRQMYPTTCARCGKATQVPFQPNSGKRVYCSECFSRSAR